jgi:hypothetical protein
MDNLKMYTPLETGHGIAYITKIEPVQNKTSMLIGSGMKSIRFDVTITCIDGYRSIIDEHTAARLAADAAHVEPLTEAGKMDLERAYVEYEKAEQVRRDKHKEDAKKARAQEEENARLCMLAAPEGTKAVLIATYSEDNCDSMTDYHGSKNHKSVIIGFSKHNRDLFPEMRKAAATFKPTQDLADAPEEAEHREKYSMGGGYYLKNGYRHSTGWKVSKTDLKYGSRNRLKTEAETVQPAAIEPSKSSANGAYRINTILHTRKNVDIFICSPLEFLDRPEFMEEKDRAKSCGGWYSRKFGKSPAGFAFNSMEEAKTFCGVSGDDPVQQKITKMKAQSNGDKFRKLADSMQSKIDHLSAPRQTNTPKRMCQAQSAIVDLQNHCLVQTSLLIMADCIDAGTLPEELQGIKSKKQLFDIMKLKTETRPNGYHAYPVTTGAFVNESVQAEMLRLLIAAKGDDKLKEEEKEQREIDIMISEAKFSKIAGYFPTDGKALDMLVDALELKDHHVFLEPSAGSGSIADRVKPLVKVVECIEINPTLINILQRKGYESHLAKCSFLDLKLKPEYDRIGMNPPFENDQHVDHFMHALKMLKPDTGLLCCIMPKGAHLKTNTVKNQRFKKLIETWLSYGKAEIINLPAKSFKDAGTTIDTQILKVDLWGQE